MHPGRSRVQGLRCPQEQQGRTQTPCVRLPSPLELPAGHTNPGACCPPEARRRTTPYGSPHPQPCQLKGRGRGCGEGLGGSGPSCPPSLPPGPWTPRLSSDQHHKVLWQSPPPHRAPTHTNAGSVWQGSGHGDLRCPQQVRGSDCLISKWLQRTWARGQVATQDQHSSAVNALGPSRGHRGGSLAGEGGAASDLQGKLCVTGRCPGLRPPGQG